MATPTVESFQAAKLNTQTTHNATYPGTISTGSTLVLIAAFRNGPTITATGWTALKTPAGSDAQSGGSQTAMRTFYKKATGSETGTFTITTSNSQAGGYVVYSITGATDPTVTPPEVEYAFVDTNQTDSNPPSITPSGGSDDYLYLTATGKRDNAAYTANPTSGTPAHTNFTYVDGGANAFDMGTTRLATTASTSEDPSVYTSDAADNTACTIAVYPTAGSGTTINGIVDALILTEHTATVDAGTDTEISAGVDSLVTSTFSASISTTVNGNFDSLVITELVADINYGTGISANIDSLVLTENSATIEFDVNIAAGTDTLVIVEQAAGVSSGNNTSISAALDSLGLTVNSASIIFNSSISSGSDALVLSAHAASISSGPVTLQDLKDQLDILEAKLDLIEVYVLTKI